MENTLVLIKPDGVQKGVVGEVIGRFERRGLTVAALKMVQVSKAQAEKHYGEHRDKPFFASLVDFITSGPLVAMIIRGENAVKAVRIMMGTTNAADAPPGTIRGDYALSLQHNIIHGSDSADSARREIANFFDNAEIF